MINKKPSVLSKITQAILYSASFVFGFPMAIVCSLLFGQIFFPHIVGTRKGLRVCMRCGCLITRINERKRCYGKQ